jgi:amino acid transporter
VRAVGPWGLTASIVNTVVGAGIFAVPGALAACVGSYAPLAFLFCAVVVGAVAICFAEGGSRVPTSGGAYGYIEAAFGPLAGYVAGTLLWVGDVLACGGIAAALADVAVTIVPAPLKGPLHAAAIVAVVFGIALVNIGGVARGARLVNGATVLKLVPLGLFIVAGVGSVRMSNLSPHVLPSTGGLGRALILATFALTGMEAPLSASGEVAEPARTIPRALGLAIGSVTLLYVAIQVVAQGILGGALETSRVPLADAMARTSPALRLVMIAGAALSMFGWLGSDLLGTPRMLFALARDGGMPRALGLVHPRTHAPHVAILSYAALAVCLALSGTFAELAVLATLATAALYVAGCAAAWRLAHRGVALAGAPLGFRHLRGAMVVGVAGMFGLIALASRAEILGLVGLVAASAIFHVLQRRTRPKPPA